MNRVLLVLALLFAVAVPVLAFGWFVDTHDPPAEQICDMLGLLGLSAAFFIGAHLVPDR